MPYWVYVKMSEGGDWQPVKLFQAENAAWLYVEKMENDWRSAGGRIPQYKVCYGSTERNRKE